MALIGRRRRQDRQDYKACGTGIADRVHNAGCCEGRIARRNRLALGADLDFAAALEDDVKLILAGMGVRSVLLAWFEAVQPGKQTGSLGDGNFAHLPRIEARQGGSVLDDHSFQFSGRFVQTL
jgi:hypothetical protein